MATAPKHIVAQVITFYGIEVGLLVAEPNWETEVAVSLELPVDISKEPITFTESRRAFAQSARYNMKWRAYLPTAHDATELRIFLTRIRGESILVPLWPDACEIQNALIVGQTVFTLVDTPVRYGAAWIIANNDFSAWEIVTVSSLNAITNVLHLSLGVTKTWPAGSRIFPLIGGRLAERPKPESITDETFEVDLALKEDTDFSFRLSTPFAALPAVGSHVPLFSNTPLFNVPPNYARPIDWTEQPDIIYQQIGFLRTEQQRVYDHRNARGIEMEFYQSTRDDITRVENFWRTQRGPILRFMVPTWRGDMRMTNNTPVPGTPTYILCEGSEFSNPGREPQPGDPFIALIAPDNTIDSYQLSLAVALTNGGTRLVSTFNVAAHTATTTNLCNLMLARFSEAKLEWIYTTPYLATTRIKFVELPDEYADPPAALAEPAYLFIFTEVGVRTDRYTSYENTIVVPSGTYAGTYTPAPFSFDTLKTGLKLDQEQLNLKSFNFIGNPLNKMWPFALDGLLKLEIVEVDVAAPATSYVSRFYGDIWSVDADYNAVAIAFGNLFDRKFPRFLLSVTDNYTQFSAPTQLDANSFKITGTLTSTNLQVIIVTSTVGHGKDSEYFAGGWLEIGTGTTFERRGILHSEPTSPNKVTLHIDRPLLKNTVAGGEAPFGVFGGPFGSGLSRSSGLFGSGIRLPSPMQPDILTISLFPGYDGSIDQCEFKFNNRINFGGHPYIPNVNPAVKAMKPKNVQGGKK